MRMGFVIGITMLYGSLACCPTCIEITGSTTKPFFLSDSNSTGTDSEQEHIDAIIVNETDIKQKGE